MSRLRTNFCINNDPPLCILQRLQTSNCSPALKYETLRLRLRTLIYLAGRTLIPRALKFQVGQQHATYQDDWHSKFIGMQKSKL